MWFPRSLLVSFGWQLMLNIFLSRIANLLEFNDTLLVPQEPSDRGKSLMPEQVPTAATADPM
jgi:hypothetical protein